MDRREYHECRKEWFANNNKACKVKQVINEKEIIELFDDDWTAVTAIRERMQKLGKEERWIDVHWEVFKGFINSYNNTEEHEVVSYLYFCMVDYNKLPDEDGHKYDEESFFFQIVDAKE